MCRISLPLHPQFLLVLLLNSNPLVKKILSSHIKGIDFLLPNVVLIPFMIDSGVFGDLSLPAKLFELPLDPLAARLGDTPACGSSAPGCASRYFLKASANILIVSVELSEIEIS